MYLIEIYWKSELTLVFLQSLYYELCIGIHAVEHKSFISMFPDAQALAELCKQEGSARIAEYKVSQDEVGSLGAVLTSRLSLQPTWGGLWQCADVQKGHKDWLSRLELIQKLWSKCWEVKDHALKKSEASWFNFFLGFMSRWTQVSSKLQVG